MTVTFRITASTIITTTTAHTTAVPTDANSYFNIKREICHSIFTVS